MNNLFTMDSSRIKIVSMTGSQWSEIIYKSGLQKKDIPEILGIGYGTIFNYEKLAFVPEKGEKALLKASKSYPSLKKAMEEVLNDRPVKVESSEVSTKNGPDVINLLSDTLQVMKEILLKGEKRDAIIDKAITALTDVNERQGRLIDLGLQSGAIKWEKTG